MWAHVGGHVGGACGGACEVYTHSVLGVAGKRIVHRCTLQSFFGGLAHKFWGVGGWVGGGERGGGVTSRGRRLSRGTHRNGPR